MLQIFYFLCYSTFFTLLIVLFLFISCCFDSFFTIPVKSENAKLKLALTIPTGAPIRVSNDTIEMLPVVTDKTSNDIKIVQMRKKI